MKSWGLATALLIAAGLSLMAAPATGQLEGEAGWARTLHHDFRGKPLPAELAPFQDDASLLRFEPQGLRITFPPKYIHPPNGVGVHAPVALGGDFEVTATVEVLKLDTPPQGSGAGVGLSVHVRQKGEQIRRVVGSHGKHNILSTGHSPHPEKKSQVWDEHRSPCTETLLRLRLKRTGTLLHYSWAPGTDGGSFAVVHEKEFAGEIDHVRLFAVNARTPCIVDVRLLDLEIRSGPKSAGLAAPASKTGTRGWMLLLGGIGIILLAAAAAGGWLLLRRRRARQSAETDNSAEAEAAAAAFVSFFCSACGANLKTRAELAGKDVKCPQCGKEVFVPRSEVA